MIYSKLISRWYVEKEICLVYYEKIGKKELKWEVSSDIGKYDNIYKISFKLYNDEGNEKGSKKFLIIRFYHLFWTYIFYMLITCYDNMDTK